MEKQVYKIALDGNQVNIILNALAAKPLGEVIQVFDCIREQGKAQDQAFAQELEAKNVKTVQDIQELAHLRKEVGVLRTELDNRPASTTATPCTGVAIGDDWDINNH